MEKILSLTVNIALQSKFVEKKDLKKVIVDTTIMPKNIQYPTDSKLYEKARVRIIKLCQKHNVPLRQNYNQVCKKLIRKLGGYLHAKQMKRARKEIKSLKTILGRVIRDADRKTNGNKDLAVIFKPTLDLATRLLNQKIKDKNKIYSLHEAEVVCISKGKSRNRYEFGSKVSLVMTHKKSLITSAQSLYGNPYDGHTLKPALKNAQEITKTKIDTAFVDKGYKGHGIDQEDESDKNEIKIFISGQKKRNGQKLTKTIRKQLKRRQAIEPIIGHIKNDGKLDLCRLKGVIGDKINAVLAACGHNLRMILKHLRKLLRNPYFVSLFGAYLRQMMAFYQEFRTRSLIFMTGI